MEEVEKRKAVYVRELRIGNWVEDYDNSRLRFQVEKIEKGEKKNIQGMYFINGRWSENVFPITMTPEILEKAGFEFKHNDSVGTLLYKKDILQLAYIGQELKRVNVTILITEIFHPQIKSIHQLQNLYFALTCQELTINL